jgi:hypothetical protein
MKMFNRLNLFFLSFTFHIILALAFSFFCAFFLDKFVFILMNMHLDLEKKNKIVFLLFKMMPVE